MYSKVITMYISVSSFDNPVSKYKNKQPFEIYANIAIKYSLLLKDDLLILKLLKLVCWLLIDNQRFVMILINCIKIYGRKSCVAKIDLILRFWWCK